jgi:hypothetical protein
VQALAAFESGLKLDANSKEVADRVDQLKERIAAAQVRMRMQHTAHPQAGLTALVVACLCCSARLVLRPNMCAPKCCASPCLFSCMAQAKEARKARRAQQQDATRGSSRDQGMPGELPAPDGWALGLTQAQQQEWLVDCYRMRVDDDYAWGGCHLHGEVHLI